MSFFGLAQPSPPHPSIHRIGKNIMAETLELFPTLGDGRCGVVCVGFWDLAQTSTPGGAAEGVWSEISFSGGR